MPTPMSVKLLCVYILVVLCRVMLCVSQNILFPGGFIGIGISVVVIVCSKFVIGCALIITSTVFNGGYVIMIIVPSWEISMDHSWEKIRECTTVFPLILSTLPILILGMKSILVCNPVEEFKRMV